MKKIELKKSRVFALAFVTASIVVSGIVIGQNPSNNNEQESGSCSVSDSEVISYLEGFGYSNITLVNGPNCNKLADTDYSYDTKVFVTQTQIIGHEDLPE